MKYDIFELNNIQLHRLRLISSKLTAYFSGTFFRLQQQGKLTKELLEEAKGLAEDDEFFNDLDDFSIGDDDDCRKLDEGEESDVSDLDEK